MARRLQAGLFLSSENVDESACRRLRPRLRIGLPRPAHRHGARRGDRVEPREDAPQEHLFLPEAPERAGAEPAAVKPCETVGWVSRRRWRNPPMGSVGCASQATLAHSVTHTDTCLARQFELGRFCALLVSSSLAMELSSVQSSLTME